MQQRPLTAREWAHSAWSEGIANNTVAGECVTVPLSALQALLDKCGAAEGLRLALENRIKVTIDASGEAVHAEE